MRIAVAYENGEVYQHFGHTEQFCVYDVENGQVTHKTLVSTNGSGHGALADMLEKLHVDALICGGIGGGARQALDKVGIRLYGGVSGAADAAAAALLNGTLSFDPDIRCSHHEEQQRGVCGEHGCGEAHTCQKLR